MLNKQKLYLLYLLFTSTAVLADTPASTTTGSSQTMPAPLKNESPADYDFRMYARNFGVSIQEAKRRFNLRHKIGNLEENLRKNNPDTFAGLWLEHTPKFRLVAQFSDTPKQDFTAYVDSEVAAITDTQAAAVSLADLEKMRNDALETIANEGIAYGTHVGQPSTVVPNSYDAIYMPIDRLAGIYVSLLTIP
jgi:hypothetical protein